MATQVNAFDKIQCPQMQRHRIPLGRSDGVLNARPHKSPFQDGQKPLEEFAVLPPRQELACVEIN